MENPWDNGGSGGGGNWAPVNMLSSADMGIPMMVVMLPGSPLLSLPPNNGYGATYTGISATENLAYTQPPRVSLSSAESVPPRLILNDKDEPYPDAYVPDYGYVPFPEKAEYTLPEDRVPRSYDYRTNYQDAWEASGKPIPEGGWGNYYIHHIQPLQYGGTNEINNLIHLPGEIHDLFTKWWGGGYGGRK